MKPRSLLLKQARLAAPACAPLHSHPVELQPMGPRSSNPPLYDQCLVLARANTEHQQADDEKLSMADTAISAHLSPPLAPPPAHARRPPPNGPPTHFLAVRVTTPGVTKAITQVHSALKSHTPGLAPALESPLKAHITMGVMRLQGQEAIAGAVALLHGQGATALAQAQALKPLALRLKGLGNFGSSVLFLNISGAHSATQQGGPRSRSHASRPAEQVGLGDATGGANAAVAAAAAAAAAEIAAEAGPAGHLQLESGFLPVEKAAAADVGTTAVTIAAAGSTATVCEAAGVTAAAELVPPAGEPQPSLPPLPRPPPAAADMPAHVSSSSSSSSSSRDTSQDGLTGYAHLHTIASTLATCFAGVLKEEGRAFNPHVTVCKMSKLLAANGRSRWPGRGSNGERSGGRGVRGEREGSNSASAARDDQEGTLSSEQQQQQQQQQQQGEKRLIGAEVAEETNPMDDDGQQGAWLGRQHAEQPRQVQQQAMVAAANRVPECLSSAAASASMRSARTSRGLGMGEDTADGDKGQQEGAQWPIGKRPRTQEWAEGVVARTSDVGQALMVEAGGDVVLQTEPVHAHLPHTASGQQALQGPHLHGQRGLQQGHAIDALQQQHQHQQQQLDHGVAVQQEWGPRPVSLSREQIQALRQVRKERHHVEKQRRRQERQERQQQQQQQQELPSTKRHPISGIPREAYQDFLDVDAGDVIVKEVLLCSMMGRKQADGFYQVVASLPLHPDALSLKPLLQHPNDQTQLPLPAAAPLPEEPASADHPCAKQQLAASGAASQPLAQGALSPSWAMPLAQAQVLAQAHGPACAAPASTSAQRATLGAALVPAVGRHGYKRKWCGLM